MRCLLFLLLFVPNFAQTDLHSIQVYQEAKQLSIDWLKAASTIHKLIEFKPILDSDNLQFRARLHPTQSVIRLEFAKLDGSLKIMEVDYETNYLSPRRSGTAPSVSPPGAKPDSGTYFKKANEVFHVHFQTFSNGRGSLECGQKGCNGPVRPSRPGIIRCTLDGSEPNQSSNLCNTLQFYADWEPTRPILIKARRIERGRMSPVVTFEYWLKQH